MESWRCWCSMYGQRHSNLTGGAPHITGMYQYGYWAAVAVVKPGKKVRTGDCWHACPLPPGHHQHSPVVESDSALARAPHLMTLAARTFFHLASVSGDPSNNAPQAIRFSSIQSDQHRQFLAIPLVSEHFDELSPRSSLALVSPLSTFATLVRLRCGHG